MKTKKLFFNIFIFIALVKVSLLEDKDTTSKYDFTLMGVDNYKNNKEKVTFGALYMNLYNIDIVYNLSVIANIIYLKNDTSNILDFEVRKTNCEIDDESNLTDGYVYHKCYIEIGNLENIKKINFTDWKDNFGKNVKFSSLMEDPNFNLFEWEKELFIFNLTNIEKKIDHFILKGNMHKDFVDGDNFTINYNDMNATLYCPNKTECILAPTSSIDNKTIDNRIAETSKSKIFIVASSLENKFIEFLVRTNEVKATIISVGKFYHEDKKNATGKIYLKCNNYTIEHLKQFIRFYVNIYFNRTRLRILETKEIIVIGNKTNGVSNNGIVSYDLTYLNTANKNITNISTPHDISFSDDEKFDKADNEVYIEFSKSEIYNFLDTKDKKYLSMFLTPVENNNYNATNLYSSFSFKFETQEITKDIEENKKVDVSYIPDGEERFFDRCFIKKDGNNLYNITCSPSRKILARLNSSIINITGLTNGKRLRTLNVRNLQENSETETFLIPTEDTPGFIDYDNPRLYFKQKDNSGLSAGAIIAIIIASIVVILAVIFIIIKCNRPAKPFVKNSDFVNIPNSSTTINKY